MKPRQNYYDDILPEIEEKTALVMFNSAQKEKKKK